MKMLSDCSAPGPLTAEHSAAYDFVDTMVPHAATHPYTPHLWHGWALREAFLRGIEWERQRTGNPPQTPPSTCTTDKEKP